MLTRPARLHGAESRSVARGLRLLACQLLVQAGVAAPQDEGSRRLVPAMARRVTNVNTTKALVAAVKDESVGTIVVAAGTYKLTSKMSGAVCGDGWGDSALCIGRNLTIRAESNGTVVLDATKQTWRVIYVGKGGRVELVGLNITGGKAAVSGGGLLIDGGKASLTSCTIAGNQANYYGGGLFINGGGEAFLTSCTIAGNQAEQGGGGLFIDSGGKASLISCTIAGNQANEGGGLYIIGEASLTSCTIAGNQATTDGGGLHIGSGGNATLTNCSIHANNAPQAAGIYIDNGGALTLTSTTVASNGGGGGDLNNSGTATYVLPAPPGHYLEGGHVCIRQLCCPDDNPNCDEGQKTDCHIQNCQPQFYGKSVGVLPQGRLNAVPLLCPLGHYCSGNTSTPEPCPAGKLGNALGLNSSECGGDCPEGSYCAAGSAFVVPCKDGTYGVGTSLQDQADCTECQPGQWCTLGFAYDCSHGTFSPLPNQSHVDACEQCPFNTSTLSQGATDPSECVCLPNFFDDLGRDPLDATDNATLARTCTSCPLGFDCSTEAATTRNVTVTKGFWRPSINATRAKPCPINGACAGGDGDQLCAETFDGHYCTRCVDDGDYLDELRTECRSCHEAQVVFGSIVGGIVAAVICLVLVLGCIVGLKGCVSTPRERRKCSYDYICRGRRNPVTALVHLATLTVVAGCRLIKILAVRIRDSRVAIRMRSAAEHVGLRAKLKICLGLYLLLAQLGGVYQIRYPADYQSFSKWLFALLRPNFLSSIPGLHLDCLGMGGIVHELVFYISFPLIVGMVACGAARLFSGSVRPALPFALFWTYFVFPSVSSHGFQAVARCDCFDITDGNGTTSTLTCFLPADYSHVCPTEHARGDVLALGALTIVVYGIGVPALYARLLYVARADIRSNNPPPDSLAPALSFLHGALVPDALWWPLVEASRTLLLTGVLALIEPGELIQIFCGVAAAMCYAVLQIWSAPYRMPGNNLLALGSSLALVLNLLSLLGIQFNAKYSTDAINSGLLSTILFVAGSVVLLATLLTLCAALGRRLTPEQLRQYLLDDVGADGDADDGRSPQSVAPLVARFGEFTINADQLTQAFNAPLLTDEEEATLRTVAITDAQSSSAASDRYSADAAALLLNPPADAARGVAPQLGVTDAQMHERMSRGVQAIEEEIEANGSDDDKMYLQLVLHEAADVAEELYRVKEERGLSDDDAEQLVIDPEYQRRRLADFVAHATAVAAGLDAAHVVALRYYTSPAFASLNDPLRSGRTPHPFPATVAFVAEGIRRLRRPEAQQPGQRLWRGLLNVRAEMSRAGGTDPAMLSWTPDLKTAASFAAGRTPLLLLARPRTFMQRGAELQFLSMLPWEREVCYPPCTLLKPTGRTQRVEIDRQITWEVVEVEPNI